MVGLTPADALRTIKVERLTPHDPQGLMTKPNPAQAALIASKDENKRAQREAERIAELAECEAGVKAVLERFGATMHAVRIIRVQPDGSEHTTYTIEITIPR